MMDEIQNRGYYLQLMLMRPQFNEEEETGTISLEKILLENVTSRSGESPG